MTEHPTYTAFLGTRRIAAGPPAEVALSVKAVLDAGDGLPLAFEDRTGRQVDFDLTGGAEAIRARYGAEAARTEPDRTEAPSRGRPKLGVVAREVTLLPRHWEWLAAQPGGASVALRKLVEAARKAEAFADVGRLAQEAASRFMTAVAGDLPGYEEASRALFSGDRARFDAETTGWPADVRDHARALARGEFL
jgi:hypothetical protein